MKSKSHTTILSIVFGFLIINIFVGSPIITYVLIALMGGSLISEKFSMFIEKAWNGLALILSYIVPNILLSAVYFLVLTPLSFLAKIFNSQTDYNLKNNATSVFKKSNRTFDKKSFERAW